MSVESQTMMEPTPPQPHLAHCCECEKLELSAALERQHKDLEHQRYEQEQGDFQIVVQAAQHSLEHSGNHRPAAESFLTTVFERFESRIKAAEMPRFR
jgi:hypothetical protein